MADTVKHTTMSKEIKYRRVRIDMRGGHMYTMTLSESDVEKFSDYIRMGTIFHVPTDMGGELMIVASQVVAIEHIALEESKA